MYYAYTTCDILLIDLDMAHIGWWKWGPFKSATLKLKGTGVEEPLRGNPSTEHRLKEQTKIYHDGFTALQHQLAIHSNRSVYSYSSIILINILTTRVWGIARETLSCNLVCSGDDDIWAWYDHILFTSEPEGLLDWLIFLDDTPNRPAIADVIWCQCGHLYRYEPSQKVIMTYNTIHINIKIKPVWHQ